MSLTRSFKTNSKTDYPTTMFIKYPLKQFDDLKTTFVAELKRRNKIKDDTEIIDPDKIKTKILNIVYGKDLPTYYNNRITILSNFINSINKIIEEKSQASSVDTLKQDKKIRGLFRYFRYRQPNCKGQSQFFIPGWFTSKSKRHVDKFDSGTSSSANLTIYNGIKDCLIFLKKIVALYFTKFSADSDIDTIVENFLNREFQINALKSSSGKLEYTEPSSSTSSDPYHYYRGIRGGSRKLTRTNRNNKSKKTKKTLKNSFKKITKKHN